MRHAENEWRNTRHNSLDNTRPWKKEASKKEASRIPLLALATFNLVMYCLVLPSIWF